MSSDIARIFGGAGFDTQSGEGMDSFDPLPAGWHNSIVDEANVVETKAKTGHYLKVRFCILDAQYNGRKIYKNITLQNANRQAEDIGHKELTSFGRAIGLITIADSKDCLNRTLQIKLKITRSEEFGDGNDVVGFRAMGQAGAAPQQPTFQPPQPPAPTYAQPTPQQYAAPMQPYQQPAAPHQPAPPPPPAQQAAPAAVPVNMPWKQNQAIPF